jgi:hypothetical protein
MWGAVAPTKWRSAKSAPPRQASTQLPESPSSRPRVRSMQTGGGPLRPAGYRAHLNRRTNPGPSLTLGDPGGGSARPLRYAPACGSGRCAPCGRVRDGPALAVSARSPSLRSGGKSARGHLCPVGERLHGRHGRQLQLVPAYAVRRADRSGWGRCAPRRPLRGHPLRAPLRCASGPRLLARPSPRCRAPSCPRAKPSATAARRAAPPCPTTRGTPLRSFVATLRPRAAARWKLALRRA